MDKRYNAQHSKAAYTLVDLSSLDDDDLRKDIIEDASAGGGRYGIQVVEESVNGGARAPIFGVYNDGPYADRWAKAKEDLGIGSTEVDDAEAYAAAGVEVTDPRRAAAMREAAAQRAEAEADRIRSGEADAVRDVTGDEDDDLATRRDRNLSGTTGGDHPQNIVDPGLARDAENEAANAENQEDEKASKTTKSKTPR
jgi:hypothetical protein